MLIGLNGKKQSGKSTITDFLVNDYDFKEISWAYPLKEIVGKSLLGLSDNQLYGSSEDKETVDSFWERSPRELLQLIGTECFRKQVHPDFWVKIGVREIEKEFSWKEDVVVSDCRFPNEADAIKKLGGKMIRVVREDQYSTDEHPSEIALDNYKEFDYIVSAKSGDIEGLKLRIAQVLELAI